MWNWISGRNKSNIPEATPIQLQRSKQIEQLKIFHQNVTEIQRDIEYRVNLTIDGKIVALYITLPPQFPQDRPLVKVTPRLHHPWVNESQVVTGSPAINNFSVHSDLGAAIKEIADEFMRNPPTFVAQNSFGMDRYTPYPAAPSSTAGGSSSQNYPGYSQAYQPPLPYAAQPRMPTLPPSASSVQSSSYSSTLNAGPSYFPQTSTGTAQLPYNFTPNTNAGYPTESHIPNGGPRFEQQAAEKPVVNNQMPQYPLPYVTSQVSQTVNYSSAYKMPEVPANFPQLRDLSNEELETLLKSEEKLIAAIQSVPQLLQLQQDREKICEHNEQISRENLSNKPDIEDKKRIILEKYDQLNELRSRFDDRCTEQDRIRQRYSPQVLQDRLRIASASAEEQSETIAENFIEGKITLEEFRRQYMEVRSLSHLRKAKEEKLNTVLVRVPFS